MKKATFDQNLVLRDQRFSVILTDDAKWKLFKNICDEFEFNVRVTGGVVLTHEISCTKEELLIVLNLMTE